SRMTSLGCRLWRNSVAGLCLKPVTRPATKPPAPAMRTSTTIKNFLIRACRNLTPELSDHGQRQDGLEFRTTVHRCLWFTPVILLGTSRAALLTCSVRLDFQRGHQQY